MEGTISSISYTETTARASMTVEEGGQTGNVEYNAEVPRLDGNGADLAPATIRDALMVALRAQRSGQIPPPAPDLGINVGEHVDLGPP